MDASSYVASYSLIIHPAFRKCRASSCGPGNFKNEERPPFFTVSSLELHHVGQGNRVNDAPWRTPVSRARPDLRNMNIKTRPTPLLAREATYWFFLVIESLRDFSTVIFLIKKNRGSVENFDWYRDMKGCRIKLGLMRRDLVSKLILISCLRFNKIIYVKLIFILEKIM